MSLAQFSKVVAAFSMPGLESIAEPLCEYTTRPKAVSIVAFVAARGATGSAASLDATLNNPALWQMVRAAAESQGRTYAATPPTFNQLHHLRRKIGDELDAVLLAMWDAFTKEAFALARSLGMCRPENITDLMTPHRWNTIYADGTWFSALSNVKVDRGTGEVTGSRSKLLTVEDLTEADQERLLGPRIAAVQIVRKDGNLLVGIPFVFAGVRGDAPLQRIVLGARRFTNPLLDGDGGEAPAAMELLERVIAHSNGGTPWVTYDRLLVGEHLDRLAKRGVVGVSAMKSPAPNAGHVLPSDKSSTRHTNVGKERLRAEPIENVQHYVEGRWCVHGLSGVDGSLRVHHPAEAVTATDPLCPLRELRFEERSGHKELVGVYEIPCDAGPPIMRPLQLSGRMPGSTAFMFNRLRPLNEYMPQFKDMHGWRQDVESLNATIKGAIYRPGRATSLDTAAFELDLLGHALMINATSWDVHAARLTTCSQDMARRSENSALRRST